MALSGEAAASLSSTSCFMQVCDSFWHGKHALSLSLLPQGKTVLTS